MTLKMVTRAMDRRTKQLLDNVGPSGLRKLISYGEELVNKSIAGAFATASDPITGNKWKRRRKAYPWLPLQKTGALRASTVAVGKVSGSRAMIHVGISGKASGYGWYHQSGTSRLPRRRFIGFSPKYRQQFSRRIRKVVEE